MQFHEILTVKVCLYPRISWENPKIRNSGVSLLDMHYLLNINGLMSNEYVCSILVYLLIPFLEVCKM